MDRRSEPGTRGNKNETENGRQVERRRFLRSGLAAAGTAALGAGSLPAAPAAARSSGRDRVVRNAHGTPLRRFGRTGWVLPVFGIGGSALVRRWQSAYGVRVASREGRARMVRHAYERGVRYFDTARIYDESESIFGAGLEGVRKDVYLATKAHTADPASVRKSVETSLENLKTDYLDCVQVHSPAIEAIGFERSMKLHAELVKLRDEKMIRFIGLTTHVAFETVHRMIATGGFDQVLLAYGYFRKGMDTLLSNRNLELRDSCIAKAHELGMGIVAMKVLGASVFGHGASRLVPDYDKPAREKLPGAAIRWVFRDERISVLNIGVSVLEDVDRNIEVFKGPLEYTHEDRKLLADFSGRAYEAPAIKGMRTV